MAVSTLHFLQKCNPNRCRDSLSICTFGCNWPRGRPLEGAAAAASGPSEQIGTVGIFTQLLLINTLTMCIPIRGQICPSHRFVSAKHVHEVKERKSSVTQRDVCEEPAVFLSAVKVSKSQKHFFLKFHCPKNKRNIRQNSAL